MAEAKRKPHPDVADALAAANSSGGYHVERVNCMDGTVAERYENTISNPPGYPIANPPVGEYCVALLRNSADVNASPKRLQERPETSLLAPYLAMSAARGFAGSLANAESLNKEFLRRADLPENLDSTTPLFFGNREPKFALTQGVALDAAFTKTVIDARQPSAQPSKKPTRNPEELYAITDSCFRNIATTLGQCAQAGRDQAALYLNKDSTVAEITKATIPASITNATRKPSQQR